MNHPNATTDQFDQEVLNNARYLAVVIDKHGLVVQLECPGIQWHLDGLCVGRELPEVLEAIVHASDGATTPQLFPYVQLTDKINVDVHVLNRETEKQIILQDVSAGHEGEHRFQQKAHQVSLLLEQQAELNSVLEEKRAEAEQASQAKSRFIAMMSHEFRSPISSIMAHAEALHGEQPSAREPAAIQRASWYLLTLVENLLEQARAGGEERNLNFASVDVAVLLNDMRELFEIQANSRGLALEVDHADDAGLVQADELRLRQVLINLLGNAMRYTRKGGIRLVCRRRGDAIEFRVQDSGKGIDENDIQRIFEPFTRVNPAGDGGAGLGLTISRQLVATMHGELIVKSVPGEGSTFSFTLPIPPADDLKSTERLDGLSMLLVEDDADIREMYRIWLEDWGLRVRTFSRCDLAVAEFEADPADLVMTDLFLEDGNGIELLTSLRQARPRLATVLCSSSDAIEAHIGGEGSVVDVFVSKPVSAGQLESALQAAIRLAKSA